MILSGSKAFLSFLAIAKGAVSVSAEVTPVQYTDGELDLLGYTSIPVGGADGEKFPAVVILPDWNNIDSFEQGQAEYMSDLGYVGFAADLYGADMHDVQEFETKQAMAGMLRGDTPLYLGRINAAIETLSAMPEVDSSKIAIIGYCLGGTGVLTYSFANTDPATSKVVAGVSFHGGLMEFPISGEVASKVLVLSGGNDDAGTAVEDLEARLKQANATWQITRYSGVEHGFAVPKGAAYNEWVAHRSHAEMETFLDEAFNVTSYGSEPPVEGTDYMVAGTEDAEVAVERAAGEPTVVVETVDYDHDGFELEGYLAHSLTSMGAAKAPGLVILPDWDGASGPNGYEAERAALAAMQAGMVAMVADIYGTEFTNVEDFSKRGELATTYRSDPELFVGRIQAAIDVLRANPMVDNENIYVAGYCFGGTGAIDYAFSPGALESVKAVVPIHGGLNPLRAVQTDKVSQHVLILSGGIDDAHGNTTELEQQLDGTGATWEITRYSETPHGFTKWGSGAYNAMADSRSWDSMMSLFADMQFIESRPMPPAAPPAEEPAAMVEEETPEAMEESSSHDGEHDEKDHDSHDHDSHDETKMDEAEMDETMAMESSAAARALAGVISMAGAAAIALVA